MKTYLFSFLLGCVVGVLYGLCRVKRVAAAHTNLSPEEIAGIPPKANKLVG